jgi:Domain of unknown function (DUF1287)
MPGDLVTWDLGLTHIRIAVHRKSFFGRRYMIEHNIGSGPKIEDVLFDWKITGAMTAISDRHCRRGKKPLLSRTPGASKPGKG